MLFSCKEVEEKKKDIVYLSPDCGCCHDWISHMESNGFNLEKNLQKKFLIHKKSQNGGMIFSLKFTINIQKLERALQILG